MGEAFHKSSWHKCIKCGEEFWAVTRKVCENCRSIKNSKKKNDKKRAIKERSRQLINGVMICEKCHKKIKSKWIEVSPGYQRLITVCDCQNKGEPIVGFSIRRHREAVALGYDTKTGRPLAIDRKGKKFDLKETRYDLKRDPRGWEASGQRVRAFDKFGRRNIYK